MKRTMKKLYSITFAFLLCLLTFTTIIPANTADAASKYITINEFAEALAKELGLKPVEGAQTGYVNALLEQGILKEGEVSSYKSNLTREDALVLINRADEYLYGDTLDNDLVQLVIDQRISDIENVIAANREDVAKGYLKGFIKGYYNGDYSTDRELRGNKAITRKGVLNVIKMIKNQSLRAEVSPDGQLIRTTKLPIYAEYYPYILASFPNEYYDWKFIYEDQYEESFLEGIRYYEHIKEYAAPSEVDQVTYLGDHKEIDEKYLDVWVEKARTHLEHVFSADYRNIDEDWIDSVVSTDYGYGYRNPEGLARERLETYVKNMKKNKTIVEYDTIAVDRSSLYFFNGRFYLRSYVKYRVVSSEMGYGCDDNNLIMEKPYNNILYTEYLVDFTDDYSDEEWRETYVEVEFSTYRERKPEEFGIYSTLINEYRYDGRRLKR